MRRYVPVPPSLHALSDSCSSGPYNPLKVDVWSLGATVWEMAQAQPPFADATDTSQLGDRLPTLDRPELFSPSFHEFLRLCTQPSSSRPDPDELLKVSVRCAMKSHSI